MRRRRVMRIDQVSLIEQPVVEEGATYGAGFLH